MNTDGLPSGFFWLLTVIGVMNLFLVVVHMVRQTDFDVLLSLVTTLLAVIVTWVCLARLRSGLSKLGDGADRKLVGRLGMMVQTLYLMANLAILGLLSFVPKSRSF
jgi:hypothetical protein